MIRVVRVREELVLADLRRDVARVYGISAEELYARPPVATREIASKIYSDPASFDGIYYASRMDPGATAVALFDRASSKIELVGDLGLEFHKDWPAFEQDYQISIL